MRSDVFLFIALIFATTITGIAQTSDDFKAKYGPPDAKGRLTIRPDIGFEVKFRQDGAPTEMIIESLAENDGGPRTIMPYQVSEDVLLELVPNATRGKKIKEGVWEWSCTSVKLIDYQLVQISVATRCTAQGGGTYFIEIRWK